MSFLGVNIAATESVAGRAAVYLGLCDGSFAALGAAVHPVGALDGTVSISPNQDIVKLQRSDGQNPYSVLETAYDFQVTFSVQEVDVFNLAMSLSYQSAPTGDDATDGAIHYTADAGTAGGATTGMTMGGAGSIKAYGLQLGSDYQSPYRSMMIRVEGGTTGSRQVAEWQFYKVKIQATGSIDYDRTGAVTYPVTAHCLGNSGDVVGQFITPSAFTRVTYGES